MLSLNSQRNYQRVDWRTCAGSLSNFLSPADKLPRNREFSVCIVLFSTEYPRVKRHLFVHSVPNLDLLGVGGSISNLRDESRAQPLKMEKPLCPSGKCRGFVGGTWAKRGVLFIYPIIGLSITPPICLKSLPECIQCPSCKQRTFLTLLIAQTQHVVCTCYQKWIYKVFRICSNYRHETKRMRFLTRLNCLRARQCTRDNDRYGVGVGNNSWAVDQEFSLESCRMRRHSVVRIARCRKPQV